MGKTSLYTGPWNITNIWIFKSIFSLKKGGALHCITENDIKLQGRQDIICDLILCSVHTEVIAWLSLSFFFFCLPRPQQGAGMMDRHIARAKLGVGGRQTETGET